MTRRRRYQHPVTLDTYFNVADEIHDSLVRGLDQTKPIPDVYAEGLTLADLEDGFVEAAHDWAGANDAPWPPDLAWAEERLLDERRNALPDDVASACHTAVAELPAGTHLVDLLDCVCGLVPMSTFDRYEKGITARLKELTR